MPEFKDVVAETRKYVKSASGDWFAAEYGTCAAIGRPLGVSAGAGKGYREQAEWDSFCGQVGRALEKLAKEDVLVKVGGGQAGPGGHRRSYNRYYLPEKHAALVEAHEAAMGVVRADNERWALITARLEGYFQVKVGTTGHRPVLTADQFEHILDAMGVQ